jgi:hypothetical protein
MSETLPTYDTDCAVSQPQWIGAVAEADGAVVNVRIDRDTGLVALDMDEGCAVFTADRLHLLIEILQQARLAALPESYQRQTRERLGTLQDMLDNVMSQPTVCQLSPSDGLVMIRVAPGEAFIPALRDNLSTLSEAQALKQLTQGAVRLLELADMRLQQTCADKEEYLS